MFVTFECCDGVYSPSVSSICGLKVSPVDYLHHAYSLHSVHMPLSKSANI